MQHATTLAALIAAATRAHVARAGFVVVRRTPLAPRDVAETGRVPTAASMGAARAGTVDVALLG